MLLISLGLNIGRMQFIDICMYTLQGEGWHDGWRTSKATRLHTGTCRLPVHVHVRLWLLLLLRLAPPPLCRRAPHAQLCHHCIIETKGETEEGMGRIGTAIEIAAIGTTEERKQEYNSQAHYAQPEGEWQQ